jgi:hypothetical protein
MCKMKMRLNVKWGVMGKGPEKLSEKWSLITSLSGCSLEQKLQSVQEFRRAQSQPWRVPGRADWPSVTDPAQHPPWQATDRPRVPGWARSIRTRVTPDSVTAVGGAGPGLVGLLWRTRAPSRIDVVNLYIRYVKINLNGYKRRT